MVYTVKEYAEKVKFGNKFVSPSTIKRRCKNNQLPKDHIARKLKGKTGPWVIEVRV